MNNLAMRVMSAGQGIMPFNDDWARVQEIVDMINTVAIIIFSLVGLGVIALAIYIGFKMAMATDDSKRKDAKRQLIYAIIGVIAVLVIIILWTTVLRPALEEMMLSNAGGGNG